MPGPGELPPPVGGAEPGPEADRLLAANFAAAEFFRRRLTAEPGVRAYLRRRGLVAVVRDPRWCLGYAPASWTALTDHLHRSGFDDGEIDVAGLAVRSRRNQLVDRFRGRLMFPLRRAEGAIVAFIGRDLSTELERGGVRAVRTGSVHCGPGRSGAAAPKYLNSPETAVFRKSRTLYGLAEQRAQLTERGTVALLVEGPMDVLAIAESFRPEAAGGVTVAALGLCGTGLTGEHVQLLAALRAQRLPSPVAVAFDADNAGRRAAESALARLRRWRGPVMAAELDDGSDPADVLRLRGPGPVRALATSGLRPLLDAVVNHRLDAWRVELRSGSIEARVGALRSVARLIAGEQLAAELAARWVVYLAERLALHPATVAIEIAAAGPHRGNWLEGATGADDLHRGRST